MRTPYQKIKLLKILDLLLHETDENHPLTGTEISKKLEQDLGEEYSVDRKSVANDINSLIEFGYDIIQKPGRGGGYYCASREFELPEVKLLADAVSASRFITEEKANELLEKLGSLTNQYEAKSLRRQVVVQNRTKTDNEKIYYVVDAISQAIEEDKALSFQYIDHNLNKERVLRHNGEPAVVSPAFLLWDNENYYMVAYHHGYNAIRNYRVDRMVNAEVLEDSRIGQEERRAINREDYAKRTFGMFEGEEREVRLEFHRQLTEVLLDRFGLETRMHPSSDHPDYAVALVDVKVSKQFFGWITGIGSELRIIGPEDVKKEYLEYLEGIRESYLEK